MESQFKYNIVRTNKFKKQYKKILIQGKDESKIIKFFIALANGEALEPKYKDHALIDNKYTLQIVESAILNQIDYLYTNIITIN